MLLVRAVINRTFFPAFLRVLTFLVSHDKLTFSSVPDCRTANDVLAGGGTLDGFTISRITLALLVLLDCRDKVRTTTRLIQLATLTGMAP